MHIGRGLEFNQGSILAEGLAEAAVHNDWYYTAYIDVCASAAERALEPTRSLIACFEESLLDEKIITWSSYDYCRQYPTPSEEFPGGRWDGVVGLVKDNLARIAGEWLVRPEYDLDRARAELINTLTITQRAPYEPWHDFFLIHGSNAYLWHSVFLAEPSITKEQNAHLIETTGHMLLFLWAGMGFPKLNMDYMMAHQPKVANGGWDKIFKRACFNEDDGHVIKLIRALKNGETVSKPYDHLPEFRMEQDMFLLAANAAMDSASEKPMTYVQHFDLIRFAGFEEAWEKVPERQTVQAQ
ncbi:hypothetical protein MMC17_009295 [Xylographa soralifera]|nr:hypothetical protein [Xylographa soralifera]